ncbi:MAG: hypothetical protein ACLP9L_20920, partial [Thermoguttaceae bacterium]
MMMSEPNVTFHVPVAHNPPATQRWWWWRFALPVGLLLAVISVGVVYLLFEPQYEASALLEIKEHPEYIAFEPKDAGIPKGYFRTQMEIIRSRWIIHRAVDAIEKINRLPEISKQPDPIDWLRKQVSVVSSNDSDVFEIKYAGGNPENAALVVNTVTEQYLKAQEEEDAKRNSKIVAELTREMNNREEAVWALRKQVQATTQEISKKEPEVVRPDPSSPIKNPLAELQARLVTVQVERAMLSARIKATEEELDAAQKASTAENNIPIKAAAVPLSKEEIEWRNAMVYRAVEDNAEVKLWHSLLVPKQMQLLQIETTAELGKQDPSYIKLLKEITKAEQKIDELKHKLAVPIQKEV